MSLYGPSRGHEKMEWSEARNGKVKGQISWSTYDLVTGQVLLAITLKVRIRISEDGEDSESQR